MHGAVVLPFADVLGGVEREGFPVFDASLFVQNGRTTSGGIGPRGLRVAGLHAQDVGGGGAGVEGVGCTFELVGRDKGEEGEEERFGFVEAVF